MTRFLSSQYKRRLLLLTTQITLVQKAAEDAAVLFRAAFFPYRTNLQAVYVVVRQKINEKTFFYFLNNLQYLISGIYIYLSGKTAIYVMSDVR